MNSLNYILPLLILLTIIVSVSPLSVIDDTNSDFALGTYNNTTSSSGNVLLSDLNATHYNSDGNYISRIFDFGTNVHYRTFRWNEAASYGGTYPDNAVEDGDFNMNSNVLLYHFSETSGSNVDDSSGEGNDGTISNSGVSFSNSANFGTAFGFDGNAAYISVPHSSDLSFQNSWSIEAWINRSELGKDQIIYSKSSLDLGISADGRPYIEIISNPTSDTNLRLLHTYTDTSCDTIPSLTLFRGNMFATNGGNGTRIYKYTKDTNTWSAVTGAANAVHGAYTYKDGAYFSTSTTNYRYTTGSSVSSITVGSGNSGPMTSYGGNLYAFRGLNLYRCSSDTVCNTLITTSAYGDTIGALFVYRNKLYFTTGNCCTAKIYSYDGSSVSEVTAAGTMNSPVPAAVVYNDKIYLGKNNGSLATFDGTTWLGTTTNSLSGLNNVTRMVVYNDRIYGVVENTRLYSYNGSTFSTIGAAQSRNLTSLLVYDGKLVVGGDGDYTTSCYVYAYGQGSAVYSNTTAPQGYNHLAATFDSDTNLLKLYLNGTLVGSSTITTRPESNTKTSYIGKGYGTKVGGKSTNGDDVFKGYIDEFAIYTRSLSQSEITQRYNSIIMDLKMKVRSCSSSNCSDSNFSGPSGNQSEYFSTGSVNYDISHLTGNRYFQYSAAFNTSDALKANSKNPTLNDVNITYNNPPDINITALRVDNNSNLGYVSYFREGILHIDFNVIDLDNDNLYLSARYNLTTSYNDATAKIANTPLSSICGDNNYAQVVSCTYDFNLYGISTGVEYHDIYIFLNINDVDFNDTSYIGTIRVDNTPQEPVANVISLYDSLGNTNFDILSYELDNNLEFDFNIYDLENDSTQLNFLLRKVSTFTYYSVKSDIELDTNVNSPSGYLNLFYCSDINLQRTPQCKINFSLENIPDGNYNLYLVFNDITNSQEIVQYTAKTISIDNTPPDVNVDYDDNWTQETIEDVIVDGWVVNTVDENASCSYEYQCRIYGPNYDTNVLQDTDWYSCRGYFYYPEWGLGEYTFDTNVYNSCDNNYTYSTRDYNRLSTYTPPVDATGDPSTDSNTADSCRPWDYTYQCRVQGPNYLIDPEQDTDWYTCSGRFNIPDFGEGEYTLSLESTDCLGNNTDLTYEYRLDNYAPNYSELPSVEYCTNSSGWINNDTTINIECVDSGSGCKSIRYYIDDNSTSLFKPNGDLVENNYDFSIGNTTLDFNTASIFGSDGNWGIRYFLEDNLGNESEMYELNVCIDTLSPIIDMNMIYDSNMGPNPYVDNNQLVLFDINKVINSDINEDTISVGIKNITLNDANYHTRLGAFDLDSNCDISNGFYNCLYYELDLNYDSDYNVLVQARDYAGNATIKIMTITYNNMDSPDINLVSIDGVLLDDLNSFSYMRDANLTIDFNVVDYEPNGLYLDVNYSNQDLLGTEVIILQDYNLNLDSCDTFTQNQVNRCYIDFNISGIDTNWYYLNLRVKSIRDNSYYIDANTQIYIDNNIPELSNNYDGNWKISDFSLELVCSDFGIGCSDINYMIDLDSNLDESYGGTQTYNSEILFDVDGNYGIDINYYDYAGNYNQNKLYILIDKTNPILLNNYDNNWKMSDFNLIIECDDLTSGCLDLNYELDLNSDSQIYYNNSLAYFAPITFTNDGNYSVRVKSHDVAGNLTTEIYNILIDQTSPFITSNYNGLWLNEDFNLILECGDLTSDCLDLNYALDLNSDSGVELGDSSDYNGEILFNSDGNYAVHVFAEDIAGNTDTNLFYVLLDLNTPDTNVQGCELGTSIEPIDISFECSDLVSGCDATYYKIQDSFIEYTAPFTLSTPADYNIAYYSVDIAGNEEDMNYLTCNISSPSSGGRPHYDIKISSITPNSRYFDHDLNNISYTLSYDKRGKYDDVNIGVYIMHNGVYKAIGSLSDLNYLQSSLAVNLDLELFSKIYNDLNNSNIDILSIISGFDNKTPFRYEYHTYLSNNYYNIDFNLRSVNDIYANTINLSYGHYVVDFNVPFRINFDVTISGNKLYDEDYNIDFYDEDGQILYTKTTNTKFAKASSYFVYGENPIYHNAITLDDSQLYYSVNNSPLKKLQFLAKHKSYPEVKLSSEEYKIITVDYIRVVDENFIQIVTLRDENGNLIPNYQFNISNGKGIDFNVSTNYLGEAKFLVPDYGTYSINIALSDGRMLNFAFEAPRQEIESNYYEAFKYGYLQIFLPYILYDLVFGR